MKTSGIFNALMNAACSAERAPLDQVGDSSECPLPVSAIPSNSLNPLLVHVYDGINHKLISAHVDVRRCFDSCDEDYLVALADLIDHDVHHVGGGAAAAFVLVSAAAFEPAPRLAYPGMRQPIFNIITKRRGGLRFFRIGWLSFSFCVSRRPFDWEA
jgi:hypothetical protein